MWPAFGRWTVGFRLPRTGDEMTWAKSWASADSDGATGAGRPDPSRVGAPNACVRSRWPRSRRRRPGGRAARRRPRLSHARLRPRAATTSATRTPTTADRVVSGPDNLSPGPGDGGTFGQLFKTSVNGSIYGQPLVDDGQLLVNTENNYSYGLDPVSGEILWCRQFGSPALASGIGCADLAPNMGITGTPVVDQATDTEYLVDDEYVSGDSGPRPTTCMPSISPTTAPRSRDSRSRSRAPPEQPAIPSIRSTRTSDRDCCCSTASSTPVSPATVTSPLEGWVAGVAETG